MHRNVRVVVLGVFLLGLVSLVVLTFDPIYLTSSTVECDIASCRYRITKRVLGLRARKPTVEATSLTRLVLDARPSERQSDALWVMVSKDGYRFPHDLFGRDYCVQHPYGGIPTGIRVLETYWDIHATPIQQRMTNAREYVRLLQGDRSDRSALAYAIRTAGGH